jgi:hypothetical protein
MPTTKEKKKVYQKEYYIKNKEKLALKKKEYKEKNRERFKEQQKEYQHEWYLKNKEKKDKQNSEWHKTHKKESVKIVQAYVQRNKEKVALYNKQFSESLVGRYRLLKYRHKKKWCDTEIITIETFKELSDQACTYCGEKSEMGIDRIENDKGYTKENSISCCKFCNYMKKHWTKEFFLEHIKKIYNHNN